MEVGVGMDCGDTKMIKDGLATLGLTLTGAEVVEMAYNANVNVSTNGNTQITTNAEPGTASAYEKPADLDLQLGQDSADTNRFWSGFSSAPAKTIMPVHRDSEVYNMNHFKRGKAVIFNHENFLSHLDLGRRHGTERDKVNLKETLTKLGFDVTVFDDLTFQEVRAEVEKLARDDHKDRDCLLLSVLSHGDTQLMYAKDYSYKPELLWQSFTADKCPSLAGKPKIFFVQACQGSQLDEGTKLVRVSRTEVDSSPQSYRIPNHADFLIAFSTVPGFYSWRNTTNGSWFVQALCTVLQKYATKKDLLSMMTIAAREVALNFESNTPSQPHMNQKKQIPFITSTLIRDIYLVPK